jgi:hypothetical protein
MDSNKLISLFQEAFIKEGLTEEANHFIFYLVDRGFLGNNRWGGIVPALLFPFPYGLMGINNEGLSIINVKESIFGNHKPQPGHRKIPFTNIASFTYTPEKSRFVFNFVDGKQLKVLSDFGLNKELFIEKIHRAINK